MDRRTPFERARDAIMEVRRLPDLTIEQRIHIDRALADFALAMVGTRCTDNSGEVKP